MPEPTRVRAYVVRRVDWRYNDEGYDRAADDHPDGPADPVPVMAFLDRAGAEAFLSDREAQERADRFPNSYGGDWPADFTTLTPPQIAARLAAAGLTIAEPAGSAGFAGWVWSLGYQDGLDAGQRAAVWDVFDRVRFFELAEIEVELDATTEGTATEPCAT